MMPGGTTCGWATAGSEATRGRRRGHRGPTITPVTTVESTPVTVLDTVTQAARAVPDIVRRRLAPPMPLWSVSWLAALWVTTIAALVRSYHYGTPAGILFDETYYATEGQELLYHGVEWEPSSNTGAYVVHPPLGKWLIAGGIRL